MSKIVIEYLRLKRKDSKKLYLFKSGNFYIFIGDDANYINDYMVLKKTKFSKEYDKCGFPIDKIEDYKRVFQNLKLNIEIIDKISENNPIDELRSIDISKLDKEEAINLLKEIKCYYE